MCSKQVNFSRLDNVHNLEGLCDHLEFITIFTLESNIFCISTSIMKLDLTTYAICNCSLDETIHDPIQWHDKFVELEVPTNMITSTTCQS